MTVVAEARRSQMTEVRQQLDAMLGQFAAVLPTQIPPKLFVRVVLTAIQNKPELLECDRRSLWNASMRAAQDGLLPDGRLGAMVIFKDKRRGVKMAQWMPMIAGLRQKVRNSGEISTWEAHVVRERDYYEFEQGDNARIVHRPVRGNRGDIIAAYSIAVLKTGERSREWMWREEIEDVRKRSRSPSDGPWVTDYSEMCRKTVARRHSKVLPMSTDVLNMISREDDLQHVAHEASPALAPEQPAPRALTDALNMLANEPQSEPDAQEVGPLVGDAGEQIDAATGEVFDTLDHSTEQPPDELERYRSMMIEGAANGMLAEVWQRFPEEVRSALQAEHDVLQSETKPPANDRRARRQ